MVNTVALVGYRPDGGFRDDLWSWCRTRFVTDHPHIPVCVGEDDPDGLFNRSRAMNRAHAAGLSAQPDVWLILDADIIAAPGQVDAAVAHAAATGRLTVGYSMWCGLTEAGSARVRDGHDTGWEAFVSERWEHSVSSLVAVPAALWERIGGFDERFEGWGLEDSAFARAAEVYAGIDRLPGTLIHLWHPRDHRANRVSRNRNRRWYRPYHRARTVEQMDAVCASMVSR